MGETTQAPDERVSEDRHGMYSVLFSNVQGYDVDEIMGVFDEFGEVVGVRRAGDDWGIHFVTFGSYEEAKSAVDGLEDHPDIKLKVHHKSKSSYQRRRRFNDDEYNNGNDRWANGCERRAMSNGYHPRGEHVEGRRKKYANNWADDSRWRAEEDCKNESAGEETIGRASAVENENSSPWYNVESYLASMNGAREEHQQPAISETINANDTCQEVVQKAECVISQSSTEEEEEEEEPVIEKAAEVIVGNVNPRTDEAYLLHLFSKYEPIAVSRLVPVTPRANVLFCSVYFKTTAVAEKVERMYDKLCLDGRQIVVQRPTRLIAAYLERI